MFDTIAPTYDLMNRVMTLGQDQRWRQFVVKKALKCLNGTGARALDLATGTGDIAALMAHSVPGAEIVGGDFAPNMLEQAKNRFPGLGILWKECDANQLPFGDNHFDAVTFGYLLRNVTDVDGVLSEVHRVLKPGGIVVCLDTTPPRNGLMRPLIALHFKLVIPLLGKLLARDRSAYQYLTDSTMDFIEADRLKAHFEEAGFEQTSYRTFMFHTIAVHWGVKAH